MAQENTLHKAHLRAILTAILLTGHSESVVNAAAASDGDPEQLDYYVEAAINAADKIMQKSQV